MKSVTWDDFSAGEYGGEDPRKWPKGAWSGVNVVRYVDGSIGPRAGFREVGYNLSIPCNNSVLVDQSQVRLAAVPDTNGGLDGHIWVHTPETASQPDGTTWVWSGPVHFSHSATPSTKTLMGLTIFGYETDPAGTPYLAPRIISTRADGVPVSLTDPPISSLFYHWTDTTVISPSLTLGRHLAFYRDRVAGSFIATLPSEANEIRFGSAGDYTPSTADTAVDVGALGFEIIALGWQRDHLAIGKEDGTWWVMTGAPNTGSLRFVSSGEPIPRATPVTQSIDGTMWWYDFNRRCPVSFDGSAVRSLPRVRTPERTALGGFDQPVTFYLSHSRATSHPWGGAALAMTVGDLTMSGADGTVDSWVLHERKGLWYRYFVPAATSLRRGIHSIAGLPNRLLMVRGQRTTTTYTTFLYVQEQPERPPFLNGATGALPWEDSYDDARAYPTELDLPQHWDPDTDVVLRGVTVDFKKFSTGDTRTNHFDIMIEAHGRRDKGTLASTQTFSFDEVTAGGVSGTDESRTFWCGDQAQGRGFQAHLSNLRGVALRGVTAHFESVGSV